MLLQLCFELRILRSQLLNQLLRMQSPPLVKLRCPADFLKFEAEVASVGARRARMALKARKGKSAHAL